MHSELFQQLECINRVFLCQKSHFRVSTSFGEFFFDRGSCWHKRWWNSLWHFSEKSVPVHASPINAFHLAALHRTRSGRMSLKNCVFGCEGKITSIMRTVDAVCFSRAATEFLKCVCWRTFINKTPVWCWICTSFNTERWSRSQL